MATVVICPECKARMKSSKDLSGLRVRCLKCSHLFLVDVATAAETAVPPTKQEAVAESKPAPPKKQEAVAVPKPAPQKRQEAVADPEPVSPKKQETVADASPASQETPETVADSEQVSQNEQEAVAESEPAPRDTAENVDNDEADSPRIVGPTRERGISDGEPSYARRTNDLPRRGEPDSDDYPRSPSRRGDWRPDRTDEPLNRRRPSNRKRASSPNWLLIGVLGGGGLVALVIICVAIVVIASPAPAPPHPHFAGNQHNPGVNLQQNQNDFNFNPNAPLINGGRRVKKEEFVWSTYRSIADNYQVDFPSLAAEAPGGPARTTEAVFFGSDLAFEVTVGDTFGDVRTADQICINFISDLANILRRDHHGGRLAAKAPNVLGGENGFEGRFEANAFVSVIRVCVHDQKLYIAIARGSHLLKDHTPSVERFMSSFRFTDNPAVKIKAKEPAEPGISLAEARRGFKTKLIRKDKAMDPVEKPPPNVLRLVHYSSPAGKLAAYLSPVPKEKEVKQRPAIIWIFGGFDNSIGSTAWEDAPAADDQSASAFRKAGIVMMYPSLRGGNDNPGFKEGFLGEVDDVLAAADFLAEQDFVDPQRIYLGGHSTGGTLALLTAASSDRFRAVFSFGPVHEVNLYGQDKLPFNVNDARELRVRAPIRWLSSVKNPTFVFEGSVQGNVSSLNEMSRACSNPLIRFKALKRADHFSCLGPMTRLIADKILRDTDTDAETNISFTDAELGKLF